MHAGHTGTRVGRLTKNPTPNHGDTQTQKKKPERDGAVLHPQALERGRGRPCALPYRPRKLGFFQKRRLTIFSVRPTTKTRFFLSFSFSFALKKCGNHALKRNKTRTQHRKTHSVTWPHFGRSREKFLDKKNQNKAAKIIGSMLL